MDMGYIQPHICIILIAFGESLSTINGFFYTYHESNLHIFHLLYGSAFIIVSQFSHFKMVPFFMNIFLASNTGWYNLKKHMDVLITMLASCDCGLCFRIGLLHPVSKIENWGCNLQNYQFSRGITKKDTNHYEKG